MSRWQLPAWGRCHGSGRGQNAQGNGQGFVILCVGKPALCIVILPENKPRPGPCVELRLQAC